MAVRQKSRLKHRPKDVRTFVCPQCGTVMAAPKYKGITYAGHIKTMWCYKCQERQDFVQVDRLEDENVQLQDGT